MVELVDTQDLESCEETRTGSIPAIRTNNRYYFSTYYFYIFIENIGKTDKMPNKNIGKTNFS